MFQLHTVKSLNASFHLKISKFQIRHYCYPEHCVLINFLDAAWLQNSFPIFARTYLHTAMQSVILSYTVFLKSIAFCRNCPFDESHVDVVAPAGKSATSIYGEFYLRSDSLIHSYWRWQRETLPNATGGSFAKGVRKENMRCFIYPGRMASRVPAYWLASNVKLNVVKLTQNYVQNSCEARV